ncbi:ribbon-helix-helix protein, CopG family [Candidatus Woesearchaeota archaeon]|nr:ribbon-helix-helix protein, CopG family [Candidatus Woesearchaeota archaeon]
MSYICNTMVKHVEVINIRLPDELIKWIDSLVAKKIYKTRSEAIREFSREYIATQGGRS